MEENLGAIIGRRWKKLWSGMGNKLKVLAQVIFLIGMVISVFQAIQVWSFDSVGTPAYISYTYGYQEQGSFFWLGLWTLLQDCALTLVIAFALYGFGIIVGFVENGCRISPKEIPASDGGTASTWTCPECENRESGE